MGVGRGGSVEGVQAWDQPLLLGVDLVDQPLDWGCSRARANTVLCVFSWFGGFLWRGTGLLLHCNSHVTGDAPASETIRQFFDFCGLYHGHQVFVPADGCGRP